MSNTSVRFILKALSIVALVLSFLWCYFSFGFEPIIAAVASLIALIGLWLTEKPGQSKPTVTQTQRSGTQSRNYQAGGDIKIGNDEE
jgi:hypothetical protein